MAEFKQVRSIAEKRAEFEAFVKRNPDAITASSEKLAELTGLSFAFIKKERLRLKFFDRRDYVIGRDGRLVKARHNIRKHLGKELAYILPKLEVLANRLEIASKLDGGEFIDESIMGSLDRILKTLRDGRDLLPKSKAG